jgi:hypothetical protein
MTTALMEVYDALREAGASEERSRAAAGAVAKHEHRPSTLGRDVTLLKWMAGLNTALPVATIGILMRSLY